MRLGCRHLLFPLSERSTRAAGWQPISEQARLSGVDELDPNIFFLLQDLDEGGVSAPVQLLDEDNQAYWAMIQLNERFPAHRANPTDDYALFQQQVEAELREEALSKWIGRRIEETYVRVDAPYKACTMDMPWLTQSINATGALGSSAGNKATHGTELRD